MTARANAIFITARTGSTRLPEKSLLPIAGDPTLVHLIRHIKQSTLAEKIVLCTTTRPADERLIDIAQRECILSFRGSEPDKLDRWRRAAEAHDVGFFVTADGDDLLTDPILIDEAFRLQQASHCEFIHAEGYPCGAFTYGIRYEALVKVCEMKATEDTEMMWGYFLETGLFRIEQLHASPELRRPEIRMTLDYPEDLEFFKAVLQGLSHKTRYTLREIVDFLDAHPEIVRMNQFRQAEFLSNQQQKKKIILKVP